MNNHIHKRNITDQLLQASCGCSGVGQSKRFNDANTELNDTLERAVQQLDSIEQLITMLMDDIDLNELKTSEKLNLALKLMAQHARTLKLLDDIRGEQTSAEEQKFADELSRRMRGEPSDKGSDDPLSSQDEIETCEDEMDLDDIDLWDDDLHPF